MKGINVSWFVCFLIGLVCGYFLQSGWVMQMFWIVVVIIIVFFIIIAVALALTKAGINIVKKVLT